MDDRRIGYEVLDNGINQYHGAGREVCARNAASCVRLYVECRKVEAAVEPVT